MLRTQRGKIVVFAIVAFVGVALIGFFVLADNTMIVDLAGKIHATSTSQIAPEEPIDPSADIGKQAPLQNPPAQVRAVYATAWSMSLDKKVQYFIDLINSTRANAIVVDVKDYTGLVSYEPDVSKVKEYEAFEKRIPKINTLIKRLHDENIYIIGRITIFQDPALAKARPDLALKNKTTGEVWTDYKKIPWMDSASQEVWDYNIAIARDALDRGFDEVNLDYIRFPSDGPISEIQYPFFVPEQELKHQTIGRFFNYVHAQLPDSRVSIDLFGEVAYAKQDIGVGQLLEDAFGAVDYISPMTYPSHYADGFIGYANPADYPYEVMKYSIDAALARVSKFDQDYLARVASSTAPVDPVLIPKIRPWVQDFDLGADYDAAKVKAQIQAIEDSASKYGQRYVNGWMIWNPSNIYTQDGLR